MSDQTGARPERAFTSDASGDETWRRPDPGYSAQAETPTGQAETPTTPGETATSSGEEKPAGGAQPTAAEGSPSGGKTPPSGAPSAGMPSGGTAMTPPSPSPALPLPISVPPAVLTAFFGGPGTPGGGYAGPAPGYAGPPVPGQPGVVPGQPGVVPAGVVPGPPPPGHGYPGYLGYGQPVYVAATPPGHPVPPGYPVVPGPGGFGLAFPQVTPQTSGLSVGALVCGIVTCLLGVLACCWWPFAVLPSLVGVGALVLGRFGINQVAQSGGAVVGRGLAIAGMVIGGVGVLLTLIFLLIGVTTPIDPIATLPD